MNTYHIHITGLVQGVGFRPHVYRLAQRMSIPGQVSNTPDGVHILFNASKEGADRFYKELIGHPPAGALIARHHIGASRAQEFEAFAIAESKNAGRADLLPAPDIVCCERCRAEIQDEADRRYRYSFTTCVDCGPRYSILTQLPYDRAHTTMAPFAQCETCGTEYNDAGDRRFYSQTNSCPGCAIPLRLYDGEGELLSSDPADIYTRLWSLLSREGIAAVKGMSGYLLLCDAYNETAVRKLRARKCRPAKPFAVLYRDMAAMRRDLIVTDAEAAALASPAGPIVLAGLKEHPAGGRFAEWIAPGLQTIGAMLPCTPLLQLIATDFGRPLVATSANISGAPIIYRDEEALTSLQGLADAVLVYERAIVTPQDDSVLQLTGDGLPIVLRRSRGLAPNYFPSPLPASGITLLGMGSELKAAFALQEKDRLYVSQDLGDQGSIDAQEAYRSTLDHWQRLLGVSPGMILVDAHPGYHVSRLGVQLAEETGVPLIKVPHHKAHFAAVLAENGLLNSKEPVLGFTWDGTGYGEDGQIWGGETFLLDRATMNRVGHLDYFPQLPGDVMSREPRLSALSLLSFLPAQMNGLLERMPAMQARYYSKWLARPEMLTSSVGRLLDGVAWLLGVAAVNSYEGEAALKLQHLAQRCLAHPTDMYPITVTNGRQCWQPMLEAVLDELQRGVDRSVIAYKVFQTLAHSIVMVARQHAVRDLAFSGGVFQNRLLVEMIIRLAGGRHRLFFHRQLSPNDECIGFGQLAYFHLTT